MAIVFLVLFLTKDGGDVRDDLESATSEIENCRMEIAGWQAENAAATSTESREELNDILERCTEALGGVEQEEMQ